MRPGDPIEVTIRGTIADVFTDIANGPEHIVVGIQYGDPGRHPLGAPLYINVPTEDGVRMTTFTPVSVT